MFKNTKERIQDWTPDLIRWCINNKYGHLEKDQLLDVLAQKEMDSIMDTLKHVKSRFKNSIEKSERKNGIISKLYKKFQEFRFNMKKVNPEDYCVSNEMEELAKAYEQVTDEKSPQETNQEHAKNLINTFKVKVAK